MRLYVITTGLLFAALALAHLARPLLEGMHAVSLLELVVTTAIPGVLALWAALLLRKGLRG